MKALPEEAHRRRILLIVGVGRVGGALARRFLQVGHEVWVWDTRPLSPALTHELRHMGAKELSPATPMPCPDAVLFCVPEEAYDPAFLAVDSLGLAADIPFLVTSGLLPLETEGFLQHPLGRMHPAFAFPHPLVPLNCMEEMCFLVQGDPSCVDAARRLIADSEMTVVVPMNGNSDLYHAACVTASNLVASLGTMAEELLVLSGVESKDVPWLIRSLMGGVFRQGVLAGFRATITGPASRKDAKILEQEIRAFPEDMSVEAQWFALGNRLIGHQLGHQDFVAELDRLWGKLN